MKIDLTKEQVRVLIEHTRHDLSFGAGGTFCTKYDLEKTDTKEMAIAQRAVDKLLLAYNK